MSVALKTIAFEKGLLTFRLPEAWTERVDRDGGGLFYGNAAEGTLRVKVMTFTSGQALRPDVALAELESMSPEPGQTVEALPSGNALRFHREDLNHDGERTRLYVWMLASVEPPHRMRLAVFSFTALVEEAAELQTRRTVALLDGEIRQARFSHQMS